MRLRQTGRILRALFIQDIRTKERLLLLLVQIMLDETGTGQKDSKTKSRLSPSLRNIVADAKAFSNCKHDRATLVVSGRGMDSPTALYVCVECGAWQIAGDSDWRVPLLARRLKQLVEEWERGDDDLDE